MKSHDMTRFRSILQAKQAAVEQSLRKRDDITVEKSPDQIENTERAVEREITVQCLSRESKLLREIRGALRRIVQDAYGVCVYCGKEISRGRLEAVPWTPLCIDCQESADAGNEMVKETANAWLADAA